MLTYISIFVTAIFVNNIVLSQFLGICPFLGVSKRIDSALGMGAAVTFVMTIATIVTYLLQTYLLMPMKLDYMQTIVFILVIAALAYSYSSWETINDHPNIVIVDFLDVV